MSEIESIAQVGETIEENETTEQRPLTDEEVAWLTKRIRKYNRNPIVGVVCDGKRNNRRARRAAKHGDKQVPANYAPKDRLLTYKP